MTSVRFVVAKVAMTIPFSEGPTFLGERVFLRHGRVGQMTEEMIEQYLEHHFEPKANDDFKMEPE